MPTKNKDNREARPSNAFAAFACLLVAIVLLYAIYSISHVLSDKPTAPSTSVLSVSASGYASATPSQALISIYINATGRNSAEATMNLSGEIDRFNTTVYPYLGGNKSLIKTSYYSVTKVYNPFNKTGPYPSNYSIPVYVAREYIALTLPSSGDLNPALTSISNLSNVYIESVSAQLSNRQITMLRTQALNLALDNATSQAQAVIGSGRVISRNISIQSSYVMPYYYNSYGASYGLGSIPAASSGQLFFNGTASVTESVYVTFHYGLPMGT